MVDRPERNEKSAVLLCIDDELLAAAIWEVRAAHRVGFDPFCDGSPPPRERRTFFLFTLLQLMLPGINPDQILQLLQQFVISPTLQRLHKADFPKAQLLSK